MGTRSFFAIATVLLAGCTSQPQSDPMAAIRTDPDCHAYRSYFPQRSSIGLHDECTRRLGEAVCRKCLVQ
jgi:hypothetical protein